ncbi:MAG: hypothetical protein ACFE8U_02705 [Candidatus Hermodarchaeota archaeon]
MKSNEKGKRSQLEKEGWEKKFTIEEHRIEEYKELYESLGQEVKVESVVPSEIEGCIECFKVECEKYRTIYTRPRKNH